MKSSWIKVKTAWSLGPVNIFYVILHRLKAKTGLDSTRHLPARTPSGPFFSALETSVSSLPIPSFRGRVGWAGERQRRAHHVQSDTPDSGGHLAVFRCPPYKNDAGAGRLDVSKDWHTSALYFGWWPRPITDAPPDWHQNPMNGEKANADQAWWQLPDFDEHVGDIKLIWEASRFNWVLAFAQRIAMGDTESLTRLNDWLTDWCLKNPPYRGVNWKCGQEASIRVLHLAMASVILGQIQNPLPGLIDFIKLHLQRIAPTLRYAISQDNNHGTSEAAALFVGGSWLYSQGVSEGQRWQNLGRKWLENRAARLIAVDGSFSQYSVNYHRLMLDTFSMVEVWRRHFDLPSFSVRLQSRLIAASQWLAAVVDPETGNAPNLGANDGARLLALTDGDGRDFRPSVHLAMVLFAGCQAYCHPHPDSRWSQFLNMPLYWLSITLPDCIMTTPRSQVFDDGGYAILRKNRVMALLRYPRFRFRPSQADLLHVDLWKDGINLLRDAGTYSYNAEPEYQRYFPSTASHNTIEFDSRDQMPRLSRFLFGDWLKTDAIAPLKVDEENISFAASYRDSKGVNHKREIILSDCKLMVLDQIDGFTNKAILRWRLAPGDWQMDGAKITNQFDCLNIRATMPIIRMQLVIGWESLHYLQKTDAQILEIEFAQSGTIVSEYEWTL